MEIKILPLGTKGPSVSQPVARAVSCLKRERGIKYQITSMGTIVEAKSVHQLFALAKKMYRAVLARDISRAVMFIELDDRRDKRLTMAGKVASLKKNSRSHGNQ